MTIAQINRPAHPVYLTYQQDIEREIESLAAIIEKTPSLSPRYHARWLAIQLLEGDSSLLERVRNADGGAVVLSALNRCQARLQQTYQDGVDLALTDQRYRFVNTLVRKAVRRPSEPAATMSDRIDRIVTHRILGIPIFLALMWVVFKLTTDVAGPFIDWVDGVIGGPLTNWAVALLSLAGLGGTWVESLLVDGIIAGVGGVLVFVPVLMSLYLALAVLEDSGYMARAAFVMDRLMHTLGLHGKSFLPMMVGFGCTVPAFYATRTLENQKDRILTGLLVPFMSCGARLPVYVLLAAVFFPAASGMVIWSMYLLGIVVAIVLGFILKHTLFRDKEQSPFIMELPPYRLPTLRNTWVLMWERTAAFLKKAWTIIMATSVAIWFLIALPIPPGSGTFASTDLEQSGFATFSKLAAPVFAPTGFGSWEASGALITGFVAKEVVVSTMAQIYGVAEEEEEAPEEAEPPTLVGDLSTIVTSFGSTVVDALKAVPGIVGIDLAGGEEEEEPSSLMTAIQTNFEESSGGHGALAALAFMVFVLLYTPCMVAVAAERQELGTKWMWVSIFGQLALAWGAALVIFQGGRLLGFG
ncbi:MAG: ferrous iron transport protein B [Chloroflexaceae bacterium]|nr:ferrous iron transport protein B [Chloroflexaceae bacterium]